MKGLIQPKDAVRILSSVDPSIKVFYDARKVSEGPIRYTVENMTITGPMVKNIPDTL